VIIPIAALAVLLLPILLGGQASRLAAVRLRHVGWIAGALAVQILIIEMLTGPVWLLRGVHVLTYLAAGWFVLANRRVPGLLLIGVGAALNGVTIALNDGTLPARPGALRSAGIDLDPDGFVNTGALAHPHLAWLGDVFAIPASMPLSNVFSVGDVLIILGTAIAAWRIVGTRWTEPWMPMPGPGVTPGARTDAPARRS
jgi:hypothetical protein